jgi:hydrogenase maturation protease
MGVATMLEHAASASLSGTERVLIIGAGDERHHDDGVGHAVVRRLCQDAADSATPLEVNTGERLETLRERWRHADLVILVAATRSDPSYPGRIHLLTTDLPISRDPAVRGGQLVRDLAGAPRRVTVYVVEGANFTPGTGISRRVAEAVDTLVATIEHEIGNITAGGQRQAAGSRAKPPRWSAGVPGGPGKARAKPA